MMLMMTMMTMMMMMMLMMMVLRMVVMMMMMMMMLMMMLMMMPAPRHLQFQPVPSGRRRAPQLRTARLRCHWPQLALSQHGPMAPAALGRWRLAAASVQPGPWQPGTWPGLCPTMQMPWGMVSMREMRLVLV